MLQNLWNKPSHLFQYYFSQSSYQLADLSTMVLMIHHILISNHKAT